MQVSLRNYIEVIKAVWVKWSHVVLQNLNKHQKNVFCHSGAPVQSGGVTHGERDEVSKSVCQIEHTEFRRAQSGSLEYKVHISLCSLAFLHILLLCKYPMEY